MIPLGNETVTLVRRTEGTDGNGRTAVTYSTAELTGCSWRRTASVRRVDNALMPVEILVCRSPANQARPRAGDLMILGRADVAVTSGAQFQRLIEQYRGGDGAFVVESVKDNARPGMPMPHYAARG